MTPNPVTLQLAAAFLLQGALFLLVVSLSLRHLFRTNHFGGAVLRLWAGLVGMSLFVCMIMPLGISAITHDDGAFYVFPEGPAVMGFLLVGWVHSIVICFVARLCRQF